MSVLLMSANLQAAPAALEESLTSHILQGILMVKRTPKLAIKCIYMYVVSSCTHRHGVNHTTNAATNTPTKRLLALKITL